MIEKHGRRLIYLVVDSLRSGGAGRQVSILANALSEIGHNVKIIPFNDSTQEPNYHVKKSCEIFAVKPWIGRSKSIFKILFLLQKILFLRRHVARSRPILISFLTENNCIACLATIGTSTKVVVCERNYLPADWDFNNNRFGRLFYNIVVRNLYRYSSIIVAQTDDGANWLSSVHANRSVIVIPNFVVQPKALSREQSFCHSHKGVFTFLYMGSFKAQKRVNLLIKAFEKLVSSKIKAHLILVGSCDNISSIEMMVARRGLKDDVSFLGHVSDVSAVLKIADAFVLPSAFEGFPNALQEAMLAGLPCIAFDILTGPRELFACTTMGKLLPRNADESALCEAMRNEVLHIYPSRDVKKQIINLEKKFDTSSNLQKWQLIIESNR